MYNICGSPADKVVKAMKSPYKAREVHSDETSLVSRYSLRFGVSPTVILFPINN